MTDSCSVLIAAADLLPALKPRVAVTDGEVLTFTDAEALRALETITKRRPRLVALERRFAAAPRGAALISRIKADPSLVQTEIRVLSHDSDYSRVVPRTTAPAPAPAPAPPVPPAMPVGEGAVAGATARTEPVTTTATLEPQALDQRGTRHVTRFRIAGKVDVLIDGNPATLIDLSTSGAGVVSPTILKPNQRVRVALADESGMLRFNASIAWASFEIPTASSPRYRAGLAFVDADAKLVDGFSHRHRVRDE